MSTDPSSGASTPGGKFVLPPDHPAVKFVRENVNLVAGGLAVLVVILFNLLFVGPKETLPKSLYLPAVVPVNGISVAECWKLKPDFTFKSLPNETSVFTYEESLGAAGGEIVFHAFPKAINQSLHHPLDSQYVFVLTGGMFVQFPNSTDEIALEPGKVAVIIDREELSEGHYTDFKANTQAITVPVASFPEYEPVKMSKCFKHSTKKHGKTIWSDVKI